MTVCNGTDNTYNGHLNGLQCLRFSITSDPKNFFFVVLCMLFCTLISYKAYFAILIEYDHRFVDIALGHILFT